jgi:hypothetical protein
MQKGEWKMIFDQIAMVVEKGAAERLKVGLFESMGADKWIVDEVVGNGEMVSKGGKFKEIQNKLRLHFNYQMGPYEFEILEILEGASFQTKLIKPGISHFGWHVDSAEKKSELMLGLGFEYLGSIKTLKHTSAQNYYYYTFWSHYAMGIMVKLIERLPGKKKSTYSTGIHALDILHRAKMLRDEKVSKYGESRYKLSSKKFDDMMVFSDIYRKYIRLENHFKEGKETLSDADLKETYFDMLNYALMGIQILELQEGWRKE